MSRILASMAVVAALTCGGAELPLSLDGTWTMSPDSSFTNAVPAEVPGSVHLALWRAGRLEDPVFGLNDQEAKKASFREWYFRREFVVGRKPAGRLRLTFGGVCEGCEVTLNGVRLGEHHGMFGGPEYDVTDVVREGENALTVRIEPAPYEIPSSSGPGKYDNIGWRKRVVFNCCYGWHYAQIPARGIWRSVTLDEVPPVEVLEPFLRTKDISGAVSFAARLRGTPGAKGRVRVTVTPKTFKGKSCVREHEAALDAAGAAEVAFDFAIPEPRLWWPNGHGAQDRYAVAVAWVGADGTAGRETRFDFGLRTIEMRPAGDGMHRPYVYDWQFVINGKPIFIKGTGWCTMDALMRFPRERYERFLTIAKKQNVNFVRAWGCGLTETEDFYDLCDEYGICVMQEWPMAWDSHLTQPADTMLDTVRRGILRLRNRVSLIMWCGGNEGMGNPAPVDEPPNLLDRVGTLTQQLDPTRPWHRQEGGIRGSSHNYAASWGRQHPAVMMTVENYFLGEFGIDCFPNVESMRRYVPDAEWAAAHEKAGTPEWSMPSTGAIAHHTPRFNTTDDLNRQMQHVHLFVEANSLENCVLGSQIAQAIGVRFTLERARTRFPACGGACMYKLNDIYPAASWACVDWYGARKYAASVVQDSFAPLAAIARLDALDFRGKPLDIPLYVVDDARDLEGRNWTAEIRAYDRALALVKRFTASGTGSVGAVKEVGRLALTEAETASVPLWIVAEVAVEGKVRARNFYFLNFEAKRGCLFEAPRTKLAVTRGERSFTVRNAGTVPAVNVHFDCAAVSDRFLPEDDWIWLEPGEERTIGVNFTEGVSGMSGWNCPETTGNRE